MRVLVAGATGAIGKQLVSAVAISIATAWEAANGDSFDTTIARVGSADGGTR